MNLSAWQHGRRLVPRWRSFASTVASGELARPEAKTSAPKHTITPALIDLEKIHLPEKLFAAAEIVESAIVSGSEHLAVDAARFILSNETHPTPLLQKQAAKILLRAGMGNEVPAIFLDTSLENAPKYRRRCLLNPRDALSWVELALHQTVNGHGKAAEHSMRIALNLSPNDRHVLRSASRLLLHREKREEAHSLIARNEATPYDPWLLAAETALASVVDLRSRHFKSSMRMLGSGANPRQLTELAGAVGTTELIDGSRKKAKRLFVQSMFDPTANSLAQGEWAAPRLGVELVSLDALRNVADSYEAQAFHLYRESRLEDVPALCEQWASIDPYSIRPFEFGVGAAGQSGDFQTAVDLAKRGLARRPDSFLLLSGRAFASASMDQIEEAKSALNRSASLTRDGNDKCLLDANRGLIAFREGRIDEGRYYYEKAISGFHQRKQHSLSSTARLYYAREALRLSLDDAKIIAEAAVEDARRNLGIENSRILNEIETLLDLPLTDTSAPGARVEKSAPVKWVIPKLNFD